MSQINDALKRAGEAPDQPPLPGGPPPLPVPGAPAGGFRTIPPPPTSSGFPLPVVLVCAALVVIVFFAAFLLARGWSRKTANSLRDSLPRAVARETTATPPPSTKPPAPPPQNPITKATTVAVNVATLGSNSVAAPTNRGPGAMVATNVFPNLKVQGIFYRARNPSAMINGKSVFVGDHVAGVTIMNITADSVTVDLNGAKKVLTLY